MKNLSIVLVILFVPLLFYFLMTEKEDNNFQKACALMNKPQVIKFSSPLCPECVKMQKVMNAVKPKYSEKITFTELNVANSTKNIEDEIKKYNVIVVPTTIFLNKSGEVVKKIEGSMTEEKLEQHLKSLING